VNIMEERKILAGVLRDAVEEFRTKQSAELEAYKADFVERLSALEGELTDVIGKVERLEKSGWDAARLLERVEQFEHADFAAKLDGLEKRLDEVSEWSLADAFCGTWSDGTEYERGCLAVHGGGLWLSLSDTTSRPGTGNGSSCWRLVVKNARAVRDA
jgi:hypothetical protein